MGTNDFITISQLKPFEWDIYENPNNPDIYIVLHRLLGFSNLNKTSFENPYCK